MCKKNATDAASSLGQAITLFPWHVPEKAVLNRCVLVSHAHYQGHYQSHCQAELYKYINILCKIEVSAHRVAEVLQSRNHLLQQAMVSISQLLSSLYPSGCLSKVATEAPMDSMDPMDPTQMQAGHVSPLQDRACVVDFVPQLC